MLVPVKSDLSSPLREEKSFPKGFFIFTNFANCKNLNNVLDKEHTIRFGKYALFFRDFKYKLNVV